MAREQRPQQIPFALPQLTFQTGSAESRKQDALRQRLPRAAQPDGKRGAPGPDLREDGTQLRRLVRDGACFGAFRWNGGRLPRLRPLSAPTRFGLRRFGGSLVTLGFDLSVRCSR